MIILHTFFAVLSTRSSNFNSESSATSRSTFQHREKEFEHARARTLTSLLAFKSHSRALVSQSLFVPMFMIRAALSARRVSNPFLRRQ